MTSSTLSSPPVRWTLAQEQRELESLISTRRSLPSPGLDVMRVCQLDASAFDRDALGIIRQQIAKVIGLLPLGARFGFTSVAAIRPELDAIARLILWIFSIRVNEASPGDAMRNLKYRNEARFEEPHLRSVSSIRTGGDEPTRFQRLSHGSLTVLMPYIWERLKEKAVDEQWMDDGNDNNNNDGELSLSAVGEVADPPRNTLLGGRLTKIQVWKLMEVVESIYHFLNLINLLVFFRFGRYRSLVDRLLKMRVVYSRNETVRVVSYDYINQQLLNEGFEITLWLLLPLADLSLGFQQQIYHRGVRLFNFILPLYSKLLAYLKPPMQSSNTDNGNENNEQAVGAPLICAKCGLDPACMPCRLSSCNHIYCYYCIKALSTSATSCLGCDITIQGVHRM
jgi:peroxin-2